MSKGSIALAAAMALAASAAAAAPAKTTTEIAPYGRDLISVVTPGRHANAPTADCLVWANAEGLGVGPAQLGGLHGIALHVNEKPLPNEGATTFELAMTGLKAAFPDAPAWLVATLQKNRAAIQAACAQDHAEPVKIYSIRPADKR